jgi:DNA polymerase III subunit delta
MDFAAFLGELRSKKAAAPAYVFAGAEALLRDRGAAAVAAADPELAANAVRLASSETDWPRLVDELHTPPFLAKRKLVVLVDEGNFVHNHAAEFREYLKQPSPANVLVALVPGDKVPALAGAVVVECRTFKKGPDLNRWIEGECQRLGKTLERAAAELLVGRAGTGLAGLVGHLEKLCSYAGSRSQVNADDVRQLVGFHEERAVYELSLAAASKDLPRAYRVLRALLRMGEPVQVLVWKLAWQYRKLAEAKKLLAAGRRRFEVTSQLQITYFPDEFLRLVDGHSLPELVGKHGEILKTDVTLKTSGGHEIALLESLVCRLAAGGAFAVASRPASG